MDFDEFIKALKENLPDEVEWYIEQSRFKGNKIIEACVKFSFPIKEEE